MPRKPKKVSPENRKKQVATARPARRKKNGTFAEGESGNPGGRPPLPAKVREYLDLHADEMTIEALEGLRFWVRNGDGKAAVPAAIGLLRKTLPDGAVKLKVEVSGPEGGPVETKVVQLDDSPASLAAALAVLRSTGVLDAGAEQGDEPEADAVDSAEPNAPAAGVPASADQQPT